MAKHRRYRDLSVAAQSEIAAGDGNSNGDKKSRGTRAKKPRRKRKNPQWELFFYRIQPIVIGLLQGASAAVYGLSGGTTLAVVGLYEKYFGVLQLTKGKKPLRALLFIIAAVVGFAVLGVMLAQVFESYGLWARMLYIGLILGGIPTILQSTTLIDNFSNRHSLLIFAGFAVCVLVLLGKGSSGSYKLDQQRLDGNRVQITLTNTGREPFADWAIRIKSGNASDIQGARLSRKDSPVSSIAMLVTGKSEKPNALAPNGRGVLGKGQSIHITYKMKNNRFLELEPIVTFRFSALFAVQMFVSVFAGGLCLSLPGLPLSMLLSAFGTMGTLNSAVSSLNFAILAPCAIIGIAGFAVGVRSVGKLMRGGNPAPYALIIGLLLGNIILVFPEDFELGVDALIGVLLIAVGGAIALAIGTEIRLDAEAKEAVR